MDWHPRTWGSPGGSEESEAIEGQSCQGLVGVVWRSRAWPLPTGLQAWGGRGGKRNLSKRCRQLRVCPEMRDQPVGAAG